MSVTPQRPSVVLVINDLIFETKIRSTAAQANVDVAVVRSAADLPQAVSRAAPSLVIVDLNTARDAVDAVRSARQDPTAPTVVAYVSHVDAALADRARDAGAHQVMPRSRFNTELPALLSDLRPSDA